MMIAICRPMPRRGASSVVDSRSGAPEPRAVTGSLLRSVEGAAEYSRGARWGPRRPTRAARSPATWLVGLGLVLASLAICTRSRTPTTSTSTTTSCGRPTPASTAASGSRTRSRTGRRCPPNWWLQDVYPLTLPDGTPDRPGPAAVPAPAGPRAAAVRGHLGPRHRPGGRRHRPGRPRRRRSPGGCWAGCASGRRSGPWPRRCSPRAPSGGGPRRSAAPGTSPTSSPRTSPWWPWASTLRHDPAAATAGPRAEWRRRAGGLRGRAGRLDRSQVLAGFLLGLAVTARLPLILAAPWFILVGGGGSWLRRLVSARRGRRPAGRRAPARYTLLTSGSLPAPGLRLPVPAGGRGLSRRSATTSTGPWRTSGTSPRTSRIMFGELPAVAPDVLPNTLGLDPRRAPVHGARRAALAVRPCLPARRPGGHRDEHPAVRRPGCCSRSSRSGAIGARGSASDHRAPRSS